MVFLFIFLNHFLLSEKIMSRTQQGGGAWQGLSWSARAVVVMLIAASVALVYSDRLMPHVRRLTDARTSFYFSYFK
jgi:uncharacterized membrane protein YhaH (DUF805 family)